MPDLDDMCRETSCPATKAGIVSAGNNVTELRYSLNFLIRTVQGDLFENATNLLHISTHECKYEMTA